MEFGYLNIHAPPGPGAIAASVTLDWKDYMKRQEEKIGKKGSLLWVDMDMEAYRCQSCKCIVFSYGKKEKHEFQEEGKVAHYGDVEKHLR
jgi:hypothetical protein